MSRTRTLRWGPGNGDRLMAAGLPDVLRAGARSMAWGNPTGLFVSADDRVTVWELGPVVDLRSSSAGWIALVDCDEDGAEVVDSNSGWRAELPARPDAIRLGSGVITWRAHNRNYARAVGDDVDLSLPMGARQGRLAPWAHGQGLVWVDGRTMYRRDNAGRISAAGGLIAPCEELLVGPGGACLLRTNKGWMCAAARRHPVHLHVDVELPSVVFSDDGQRAVAETDAGTSEIDLRTGTVSAYATPVAEARVLRLAPSPIFMDEERGFVIDAHGNVLREGFVPTAVSYSGNRLYGPGASAWDLRRGRRVWGHPRLAAEHIVAFETGVAAVIGAEVAWLDAHGTLRAMWSIGAPGFADGAVAAARDGERIVLWNDDGDAISALPDGSHAADASHLEEPDLDYPEDPLPFAADASTTVFDTRWLWSEEGMLITLAC